MGAGGASALAGTANLAGAYSQYNAYSLEGKFARNAADQSAEYAEKQAQDVIRRGFKEASLYKKKVKQMQGSQKAALAAQGIEISSGSAYDILEETAVMSEVDAMTIKNNAYLEAYGLKAQAINIRAQGRFDQISAKAKATSSLITGGLKAAGNFYESYGGKTGSKENLTIGQANANSPYSRSEVA